MRVLPKRLVRRVWCGVVSTLSLLASCAGDESPSQRAHDENDLMALESAPTISAVRLLGPGCGRARDSVIRISEMRETFEIEFIDLRVPTEDESARRQIDCTVSVSLNGEAGIAYAPAGFDLEVDSSAAATLSTTGYWTTTPGRKSSDVTTTRSQGPYITGALDDIALWSSCTGARELRFSVKLGLVDRDGRAGLKRLSGPSFYARPCPNAHQDASAESSDAGASGPSSLDGNVDAAPAGQGDAEASPSDASSESPAPDASISVEAQTAAVSSVSPSGLGCDGATTTTVRIPEGRDTFDVDFLSFSSEATAGRRIRTTSCLLSVDFELPKGKTVALERFTAHGSASLPSGASGRVFATYDFAGTASTSVTKELPLVGPLDEEFELKAAFAESEWIFRPCSGTRQLGLNLNVNVRAPSDAVTFPNASLKSLSDVRFRVRDCP